MRNPKGRGKRIVKRTRSMDCCAGVVMSIYLKILKRRFAGALMIAEATLKIIQIMKSPAMISVSVINM